MHRTRTNMNLSLVACLSILAGCSDGETPNTTDGDHTETSGGANATRPAWLLASAPAEPQDIIGAKATAKAGDEIVLTGRIGGRVTPITDGSPVFTIVDLSMLYCGQEETSMENCPTPWDYCCDTKETIAAKSATVQIVNADGTPITESPAAHGLTPLDEVIVVGTVQPRPNTTILTVQAEGVYRIE